MVSGVESGQREPSVARAEASKRLILNTTGFSRSHRSQDLSFCLPRLPSDACHDWKLRWFLGAIRQYQAGLANPGGPGWVGPGSGYPGGRGP